MTPDQAMQGLIDLHRPLFRPELANGHPYIIWVTAAQWDNATRGDAPWFTITHHRDMELAMLAWHGRPDPHGWSPTTERCIAVIAPRV